MSEEAAVRLAAAAGAGMVSRLGAAAAFTVAYALGTLDAVPAAAYTAGLAGGEALGRALEMGLEREVSARRKPSAAQAAAREALSRATPVLGAAAAAYAVMLAAAGTPAYPVLGALAVALASAYRSLAGHALLAAGLYGSLYRAAIASPAVALLLTLISPRPGWGLAALASGLLAGALMAAAVLRSYGLLRWRPGAPRVSAPEPAALLSAARMAAAGILAVLGYPGAVAASLVFDAGLRVGVLAFPRYGRPALAAGFAGLAACPALGCGAGCYAYAAALGVVGLAGFGTQPPSRGVLTA